MSIGRRARRRDAAGARPAHPWCPARRLALAGVAAIVLAAGGGFAGAAGMHAFDHTSTSSAAAATSVQTVAGAKSIADVVSAVDQEVVSITVRGQQQADEGSGVVVRSDGLILTNNHVIAAAAGGGSVQVTFTNGKTVSATIVKADPQEDLALIQAQGVSGLKAATFGDSDNLQIGDTVIAIGNELGLSNSVSAGIVSALHRQVTVGGEGGGSQSVAQSTGDHVRRRDPDRCVDQPGRLRRRAVQHGRSGRRHQQRHRDRIEWQHRQRRDRLRHLQQRRAEVHRERGQLLTARTFLPGGRDRGGRPWCGRLPRPRRGRPRGVA